VQREIIISLIGLVNLGKGEMEKVHRVCCAYGIHWVIAAQEKYPFSSSSSELLEKGFGVRPAILQFMKLLSNNYLSTLLGVGKYSLRASI
jgi:hypothetical protein